MGKIRAEWLGVTPTAPAPAAAPSCDCGGGQHLQQVVSTLVELARPQPRQGWRMEVERNEDGLITAVNAYPVEAEA
jgi:hypothetical protein